MSETRRYCLLSPGRAGSKVLCDALNSCDSASATFEIFHPGLREVDGNFFKFLLEKNDPRVFMPDLREEMFLRYLRETEAEQPQKSIFVYDVKYFHIHHTEGVAHSHTATPYFFSILSRNFAGAIHLTRLNGLRACISMYVANARGKWHSTSSEQSKSLSVNLPLLLGELRNNARESRIFTYYLNNCGIPVLEIAYEDLFDGATGNFDVELLQKLEKFIQLPQGINPNPPLVKTMPEPLSAVVENYDELRKAVNDWIERGLIEKHSVFGRQNTIEEC
jgi:LPS sulfotransferase NodH